MSIGKNASAMSQNQDFILNYLKTLDESIPYLAKKVNSRMNELFFDWVDSICNIKSRSFTDFCIICANKFVVNLRDNDGFDTLQESLDHCFRLVQMYLSNSFHQIASCNLLSSLVTYVLRQDDKSVHDKLVKIITVAIDHSIPPESHICAFLLEVFRINDQILIKFIMENNIQSYIIEIWIMSLFTTSQSSHNLLLELGRYVVQLEEYKTFVSDSFLQNLPLNSQTCEADTRKIYSEFIIGVSKVYSNYESSNDKSNLMHLRKNVKQYFARICKISDSVFKSKSNYHIKYLYWFFAKLVSEVSPLLYSKYSTDHVFGDVLETLLVPLSYSSKSLPDYVVKCQFTYLDMFLCAFSKLDVVADDYIKRKMKLIVNRFFPKSLIAWNNSSSYINHFLNFLVDETINSTGENQDTHQKPRYFDVKVLVFELIVFSNFSLTQSDQQLTMMCSFFERMITSLSNFQYSSTCLNIMMNQFLSLLLSKYRSSSKSEIISHIEKKIHVILWHLSSIVMGINDSQTLERIINIQVQKFLDVYFSTDSDKSLKVVSIIQMINPTWSTCISNIIHQKLDLLTNNSNLHQRVLQNAKSLGLV